jgi:hypothetical protein
VGSRPRRGYRPNPADCRGERRPGTGDKAVGRPSRLTPAVAARLALLTAGCATVVETSRELDVVPRAIARWLERDAELAIVIAEAIAIAVSALGWPKVLAANPARLGDRAPDRRSLRRYRVREPTR